MFPSTGLSKYGESAEMNTHSPQTSSMLVKDPMGQVMTHEYETTVSSLPKLAHTSPSRPSHASEGSDMRHRQNMEHGFSSNRPPSIERRLYSRETASIRKADRAYDSIQSQLKLATRSSGYRELLKQSRRTPSPAGKLPPMDGTFSLTQSNPNDDSGMSESGLSSYSGDIVSLANSSFQQKWTALSQPASMYRKPKDAQALKESLLPDQLSIFDKTLKETNQLLDDIQLYHIPEERTVDPSEIALEEELQRIERAKKLAAKQAKRNQAQYLDVKEIQTLIQRQVAAGLLDAKDAPELHEKIPLNSRLADLLVALTSPLSMKINSRFSSYFDSAEWEGLHKHSHTTKQYSRNFIQENADKLLHMESRENRTKAMAQKREQRINHVLTQHQQVLEEYHKRMSSLARRREEQRYQKHLEEFVFPRQRIWMTVLFMVKFNRFMLRFNLEMRELKFDLDEMNQAASIIQAAYRKWRSRIAREKALARLKIVRFLTTVVRRVKVVKAARSSNMIIRFLRDVREVTRAKYAIRLFTLKCLRIQRWWRAYLRRREAQILFISRLYVVREHLILQHMPTKERQEFQRLSIDRKKFLATQQNLHSNKKRHDNRRASAFIDPATFAALGIVTNQPSKLSSQQPQSAAEDIIAHHHLSAIKHKKTKPKQHRRSLEDACLIDEALRLEIIRADWAVRRQNYHQQLLEYYAKKDALDNCLPVCKVYDFSSHPIVKRIVQVIELPPKPKFSVMLSLKEMEDIANVAFLRLKGLPLEVCMKGKDHLHETATTHQQPEEQPYYFGDEDHHHERRRSRVLRR